MTGACPSILFAAKAGRMDALARAGAHYSRRIAGSHHCHSAYHPTSDGPQTADVEAKRQNQRQGLEWCQIRKGAGESAYRGMLSGPSVGEVRDRPINMAVWLAADWAP